MKEDIKIKRIIKIMNYATNKGFSKEREQWQEQL